MPLERLHGRKVNDYLLRKGRVWKGKTMIVRWLPGPPRSLEKVPQQGIHLGTMMSAKSEKSAVLRNRMRRRVREAFRLHVQKGGSFPTVQLLVSPTRASLDSPFALLEQDVQRFLSALPSWPA